MTVKVYHRMIIEFFTKVGIIYVIAVILGGLDVIVECVNIIIYTLYNGLFKLFNI